MKNIKKRILQKFLIVVSVIVLFFNIINPCVVKADIGRYTF